MSLHGEDAPPLSRKLGIKPGARVAALGTPPGFVDRLDVAAAVATSLRGSFDVIVQFARARARLSDARLAALIAALEPRGALWIAWPKQSSGVVGDLDDRAVRDAVLATGLVDNKVCAIDETWSGLRFVRRLPSR